MSPVGLECKEIMREILPGECKPEDTIDTQTERLHGQGINIKS